MFDFESRMGEFMLIAALALIVIGPKDLPVAMRKLGQFIGKLRGMAAEFRASFDELARQSELDELRKEVEALRNSHKSVVSSINPMSDSHVSQTMNEINEGLNEGLGQVSFAPPMSSQINAERAAAEAAKTAEEAPMPAEPEAPVMTAKPKAPRKPRAKPAAAKAETKATDPAS